MKTALILVDPQKDFLPGGALAVPGGDEILEPVNRLVEHSERRGHPVFLTRDWHPADHSSFTENGGPWPPHCIADTPGAEFHSGLNIPGAAAIVSKATSADVDAYSGFQGTDLSDRLRKLGVSRLIIAGLATDYCVKNTVLDGLQLGFSVTVIRDGIRAVNVDAGDEAAALEEMTAAGATFFNLSDGSKRQPRQRHFSVDKQ